MLVLMYAAGVAGAGHGFVGVDILFVLSGYLLTGPAVRELVETSRVRVLPALAHRARRVMPPMALVVALSALVAWFVVPGARRRDIGADVLGSAGFVVDWVLGLRGEPPHPSGASASPLHHLWAIAAGAQATLLWLVALALLGRLIRRAAGREGGRVLHPTRRLLALVLALVCVPSFLFSLWQSQTSPSLAYLVSPARFWEFGVGALLAVWTSGRRPYQSRVLTLGGWLGLAMIAFAATSLPADALWPGAWALLPTIGAALVIASGWSTGTLGPSAVLSWLPLVWLGGLAYALYLWHWPMRTFAAAIWGESPGVATVAVAAALVPAWLTTRFVEDRFADSPLVRRRPRSPLVLTALMGLAAVLAGLPLLLSPSPFTSTPPGGRMPALTSLGAATLGGQPSTDPARYAVDRWEWVTPDPQRAGDDVPASDSTRCVVDEQSASPVPCQFGNPSGKQLVALVGDEKAMQWLPALEEAAKGRSWRIVTYGKAGCPFVAGQTLAGRDHYSSCDEWNTRVMRALAKDRPALVVTSGHARTVWDAGRPSTNGMITGLATRWQEVRQLGSRVAVVGDNPSAPTDLEACLSAHPTRLSQCDFDRAVARNDSAFPVQKEAAAVAPVTDFIDLTPWLCPVDRCPSVIGNVVVNRPGARVTATYAATLGRVMRSALDRVLATE
ncbi:MAG: acyltransferase [Micrococcales bacterium]|nr:acyltransferase [Micrococcales bacterium]